MVLDSSGNVGIGTSSPTSKLTVSGDIEIVGGVATIKNSSGFLQLGTTSNDRLEIITNNTERARITSDGVLAVNYPTAALADGNFVVYGSNGTGQGAANTVAQASFIEATSGNAAGLWLGAMTNENTAVIGTRTATGNLAFQTYNGGWGERMRLTYTGNLLVGSNSTAGTNAPSAITVAGRLRSVAGSTASIANGASADIALTMPFALVGYIIQSDFNTNNTSAGFFRSNNDGASSSFVLFSQSEAGVTVTSPSGGTIRVTNGTGASCAFNYRFTVLAG
jgi:hypothetical protein